MILPNDYSGLDSKGFAAQEKESLDKRLQPANPTEFLKWVTQTLRDQRAVFDRLDGKRRVLGSKQDRATMALKNLDKLVSYKDRASLDHMKDMHRSVVHQTRGVGSVLARCKSVIDETTASYQFVGETLKSGLADRHKKIAMQKELGLRLRDLDEEFKRCESTISSVASSQERLSSAVQKLLSKLKVALPPTMRDNINKQEKIAAIAKNYGKKLTKEKAAEIQRKTDDSLGSLDYLGDQTFGEGKPNLKPLLAIAGGVVLGHILITKVL